MWRERLRRHALAALTLAFTPALALALALASAPRALAPNPTLTQALSLTLTLTLSPSQARTLAELRADVDAVEPADLRAAGSTLLPSKARLRSAPAVGEGAGGEAADAEAEGQAGQGRQTGEAGEAEQLGVATEAGIGGEEAGGGVEAGTPAGVAAAAQMLAGWLTEARAVEAGAGGLLTFCTACGFTLPCPWGC